MNEVIQTIHKMKYYPEEMKPRLVAVDIIHLSRTIDKVKCISRV